MAAAAEELEVVRVRVKKCEGLLPPVFRTFAVDPQITSFEVLQHILIRAFDLSSSSKKNFIISYLSPEKSSQEVYLSLQSDWDLDVAFSSLTQAYLQLKVDIKPSEDSPLLEDWDIISPKDVISSDLLTPEKRTFAVSPLPLTQSIISQVGRTLSKVQQVLSWAGSEEAAKPFKPPLGDAEFHTYLNHEGQLCRPEELRLRIYHGGVEPGLRKVVWRYLLNVYPEGLTGQQRLDYMKRKSREYERLKAERGRRAGAEQLEQLQALVHKDVARTDRGHPYYAGPEEGHPHLAALRDLLTTYAVAHPRVSYCQGMSDLASPLLAVMDDEAHAYVCFCGLMRRLEPNFRPDGEALATKFGHLQRLLRRADPTFYAYLRRRGAHDLFFCYRWLLLELKREFAFDDALRLAEVAWSSLPPDPPVGEVPLTGEPLAPGESPLVVRPTRGGGGGGAGGGGGGGGEEGGEGDGDEDDDGPLPPPHQLGGGHPFVLFLCLALLLEHRDRIVGARMDYNELAMHFDRLVRRQDLRRVTQRARALFADYLQGTEGWAAAAKGGQQEEGSRSWSQSPTGQGAESPASCP
ncbi:TBC1 domain family member 25 isoform X1 [Mobula birostris]|uniref:TBC1 domain family member 25 isoform X1 n=1 Tax=Mobula birostris TaxID=1983395 RepID=UPI003B27F1C9